MNDYLEFIEDLEAIDSLVGHPAFEETLERIKAKYENRIHQFEMDMEQQYTMNFLS